MLQRIRAARQQKESGFTLTELLIVIVILGILAGIVVFAVSAFNDRGEEAACKADYKATQVAVEAYYAKEGAYPTAWANIVPAYLKDHPGSTNANAPYVINLYAQGVVTATGSCTLGTAPGSGSPFTP